MLVCIIQTLLLLLIPTITNVGGTQTPELKTLQDVSDFMQTYYLHPRPEFVGNLIEALQPTAFLQKRNNINPVVGFFSEVFAANANWLPQWQLLIARQDEQTCSLTLRTPPALLADNAWSRAAFEVSQLFDESMYKFGIPTGEKRTPKHVI
jgi:hypothetical protein